MDIEDLLCQSLFQGDKKIKDRPCLQWIRGDRQSLMNALVSTHFHRGIPFSRGWNPATLTEQGTGTSQIPLTLHQNWSYWLDHRFKRRGRSRRAVAVGRAGARWRGDEARWVKEWLFLLLAGQIRKQQPWDFPGGPVVKTPCSHYRRQGFDPWSGKFHMLCGMAKKRKKTTALTHGRFGEHHGKKYLTSEVLGSRTYHQTHDIREQTHCRLWDQGIAGKSMVSCYGNDIPKYACFHGISIDLQ